VDSYKGLIFGNFDPTAPSLRDYLGDMTFYLDYMLDRREGGTEIIGGVHKWIIPCNWKFAADNFQGDSYHVPTSHATAFRFGFARRRGPNTEKPAPGIMAYCGNGHGLGGSTAPVDETEMRPEVTQYSEDTEPEKFQRLGERASKFWPIHGTVFPNLSLLWPQIFRTLRVWHPRGPDKTEVWAWCIADKAASPEIKQAMLRLSMWTFSAGGFFEQDDMENWQTCTETARGVVWRRYPQNIQMGLNHEYRGEDLPGVLSRFPSETNQRGFYDFWSRLMTGQNWQEIKLARRTAQA
ncbi:MAG TPA: RHO alpha subunit C-terminal catalytic domain-containing protein, partial [Dehalococcoidia bacterium]|nr:RHO alpha subunit C-terminal catalytic domain-containing protein [Dehalococcoidia bacterium]